MNGLGHQVMQEPQPLSVHLGEEEINAGGVPAGPGKAWDKTHPANLLSASKASTEFIPIALKNRSLVRHIASKAAERFDPAHSITQRAQQQT